MINVIGLDIGTSSVKGVAVGPKGERLSAAKRDFTYQSPREGWKELAAEDYLETCGSLLRQLASAESGEIGAVCAASASGNLLVLDSDGTPLTKIINWQDRRVKEEAREEMMGYREVEPQNRMDAWNWSPVFAGSPLWSV